MLINALNKKSLSNLNLLYNVHIYIFFLAFIFIISIIKNVKYRYIFSIFAGQINMDVEKSIRHFYYQLRLFERKSSERCEVKNLAHKIEIFHGRAV